ncbi:hypothetical protein HDV01_002680 [Terramyces sp. JEL0728]|nr:hypothetical protein HDV01_002680 [Terramyces sp. JEL0728]
MSYSPQSEFSYSSWKSEMKHTDRHFIISELATLIAKQLPHEYNSEQAAKQIEQSVYETSTSRQEYCYRIREHIVSIRNRERPQNQVYSILGQVREIQKYLASNGMKEEFLKLADIEYAIKNSGILNLGGKANSAVSQPKKENTIENYLNRLDINSHPPTGDTLGRRNTIIKLGPSDYKTINVDTRPNRKSVDIQREEAKRQAELKRRTTLVKLSPKEELKRRGTVHEVQSRKLGSQVRPDCDLRRRGTLVQLGEKDIKQRYIRRDGKPLIDLN